MTRFIYFGKDLGASWRVVSKRCELEKTEKTKKTKETKKQKKTKKPKNNNKKLKNV